MLSRGWQRVDGFMRLGHLYTGLFLVPWMAIYATSAFCLNHPEWFPSVFQNWGTAREVPFAAEPGASQEPADLARAILKKLDIDGPHRIIGQPSAKELSIWRNSASGDYKIVWRRDLSRVTVQRQQPPSLQRVVHSLHFGRGYDRRYLAATVWAASVDAVIVSTWFWVVSGIYIWARRPKQRLAGGICLACGGVLFAVLVLFLCR